MNKEQLAAKYGDEEVFVLSKKEYFGFKNGITPISEDEMSKMIKDGFFVYRKDAEYNPDYLQIIPYVLIKHKDEYFTVTRIGGEERLIGKISLGMGGHINPEDMPSSEEGNLGILHNNIYRELEKEELHIDMSLTKELTLQGLIMFIHPTDIVSQDHIGAFYLLDTDDSNVSIKESDKLVGDFLPKEDLIALVDKSESWTRIIIEDFLK